MTDPRLLFVAPPVDQTSDASVQHKPLRSVLGVFALVAVIGLALGQLHAVPADADDETPVTLYQYPYHPALIHAPAIPLVDPSGEVLVRDTAYAKFHELLEVYTARQAEDDNFTIRVIDQRSGTILERFVLEDERAVYDSAGVADWDAIDRKRRAATRELSDHYAKQGVPREAITIKWGRLNQVKEARERDAAYIEHELRLAQWLGLSLLVAELGTVETFNQDWMVSSVGARSRYQLMPYMLEDFDVESYTLKSRGGRTVRVREERHPLIAMIPAFTIARAYANAVGHELPGLAAYNSGPGNLFRVMRMYLANTEVRADEVSVLDGYIWGVTDGYAHVSRRSSFRTSSRGFMPTAYGSLRAVEHDPIDRTQTFTGELVTLRPGIHVRLTSLLRHLESRNDRLDWGFVADVPSLYERFRIMNPHFPLESEPLTAEGLRRNNLVFTGTRARPVRLFVPLGTTLAFAADKLGLLETNHTLRFDEHTFTDPVLKGDPDELDAAYAEIVRETMDFGFTPTNLTRLRTLRDEFRERARQNPTLHNRIQAEVIRLHVQSWGTRQWRDLAEAVRTSLHSAPDAKG